MVRSLIRRVLARVAVLFVLIRLLNNTYKYGSPGASLPWNVIIFGTCTFRERAHVRHVQMSRTHAFQARAHFKPYASFRQLELCCAGNLDLSDQTLYQPYPQFPPPPPLLLHPFPSPLAVFFFLLHLHLSLNFETFLLIGVAFLFEFLIGVASPF